MKTFELRLHDQPFASIKSGTKTIEIFNCLNGNIHLIKGNHDGKLLKNRELRNRFIEIVDYKAPRTHLFLQSILRVYLLLQFHPL